MKLSEKSYAKINLHLAIGPKRKDNFHDIQSIFAKIDLYDIIEIEVFESDLLDIEIKGLEACEIKGEDSISKAIRLWCEKTKINLKIKVFIDKQIPIQAGLGGGSSNAATVLKMLNDCFKDRALKDNELLEISLKVGSDVPFFLYNTTFAYVEGQGEIITPLDADFDYGIYLVKPSVGVSTKGAFDKLDSIDRKKLTTKDEIIRIFNEGLSSWKENFYNDFELVVNSEILSAMKSEESCFSLLSGSGSTCFCVYNKLDNCYQKFTFYRKFKHKNYTKSCFFSNI
jgi:4-diphosphocytidyl-2-C-methyl-D-erythritol kinase